MIQHAITIIGFRRPVHITNTLVALANNYSIENTPLYIYIDGPRGDATSNAKEYKQVQQTIEACEKFPWNGKKIIHAAKKNKGLQQNVRYAIDTTLSEYPSTIIVEDDIITSPYFYLFMTQGLEQYKDTQEVAAICGHCYPFARKLFNPTEPYF